jgi:hypothetical protein
MKKHTQFLHIPLIALLAVACVGLTACGTGASQVSDGTILTLDERLITVVFEGKVVAASEQSLQHDIDGEITFDVAVSDVYWDLVTAPTDQGDTLWFRQVKAGDRVPISSVGFPLKEGGDYVFAASAAAFGGPDEYLVVHTAYDAETMEQLPGRGVKVGPSLTLLLDSGQSGPSAEKSALAALVAESWEQQKAQILGQVPPVAGIHLERAWASRSYSPSQVVKTEPIDENLGMSVSAYLGLDPGRRQLLPMSELPTQAIEQLDLVSFAAIVTHDADLADSVWAIGFRTPAGFVGPFVTGQGVPFDLIEGVAPRNASIQLVEWKKQPPDGSVDFTSARPVVSVQPLNVGEGIEGAFVVDMNSGSVSVVDEDEARSLIFQMASELPQGPENGFGSGEAGGS